MVVESMNTPEEYRAMLANRDGRITELEQQVEALTEWVDCEEKMPPAETPVLGALHGEDAPRVVWLRWEEPTYEETHKPFLFWDDWHNDGQIIDHDAVYAWRTLPELPATAQQGGE